MECSEEPFREALAGRYRHASDAALRFMEMQFNPDGIVVSGNPDPANDRDIDVVHYPHGVSVCRGSSTACRPKSSSIRPRESGARINRKQRPDVPSWRT